MLTIAKEQINKIVEKQPEDSSYTEIMMELVFAQMIDRGLDDSKNGRLTNHSDNPQPNGHQQIF